MIKTWRNGARDSEVKEIIDYNFNFVSRYLPKDIKALSTQERNLLPSDYLSENILVFDTDEEQWFKYSKGSWVKVSVEDNTYSKAITVDDWQDKKIQIPFTQHGIKYPIVQLFMKHNSSFIPVLDGAEIDSEYNIILSTDLPFNGKVVVK